MFRPDKKTYELTEAEQRDLTTLIRKGRPLPEKYRFILFEDKREVARVNSLASTFLEYQA